MGLLDETLLAAGVRDKVAAQDFDGDEAVEAGVAGFVNFAHAAGTERVEDLVVGEGAAGHGGAIGLQYSSTADAFGARVLSHTR